MNFLARLRTALLVCLLLLGVLPMQSALAYEAELEKLATDFVTKLDASGNKSAAVFDFTDLQGASTVLGKFLAQEFSDQLVSNAKTVTFVDRANLQLLLRENKLTEDGLINPETSQKLGQMIGIDTIVFGTITPISKTSIKLSIRAVAVQTGKIMTVKSASFTIPSELMEMYTQGLSVGGTEAAQSAVEVAVGQSPLDSLRADAIGFSGSEVKVFEENYFMQAVVSLKLKNSSGMALNVGLVDRSATIGGCDVVEVRGLEVFQSSSEQIMASKEKQSYLVRVPQNGEVVISMRATSCDLQDNSLVDLTAQLIIVAGDNIIKFPANKSGLKVNKSKD
jgi:hypothetical protein